MIRLYDYQSEIVTKARQKMAAGHKHIMIQSPTGSGKTVIFSYIVSEMTKKNKRALIITDRIELLTETGGTLDDFGILTYKLTAGQVQPPDKTFNCCIAMAQTLRNRLETKKYVDEWGSWFRSFDLVIIDEAHKQEFNPFFNQDGSNKFNGAYLLGFTATPKRTGKQSQLAKDYSCLITGLTVDDLIRKGRLLPDRYFGVDSADTSGIRIDSKTGDFDENEVFNRFNRPELYAGVVEAWLKHTPETITLCFCVNIRHAIETCEEFNKKGVKAKFIVSDVARPKPLKENHSDADKVRYNKHLEDFNRFTDSYQKYSGVRSVVLDEWERGEFPILINAGILTTGFNYPPIQTIIVNRATMSDNLWLQMIGRGSRTYEDKEYFNILDFGGHGGRNGGRLGNYRDRREYSLIHETRKGGGEAPVKECGKQRRKGIKPDKATGYTMDKNGRSGCGSYIAPSVMICPYCGYQYDTEKERIFAELELINYGNAQITEHQIRPQNNRFSDIERTAAERGYKQGWVTAQIALRYGATGLREYAKIRGYSLGWAAKMASVWKVG